jgi:sensor histidine kinase YesM
MITIRAARDGGFLHLSVEDDGPGFGTRGEPGGLGLGLSNTRARLKQLYGEPAGLQITGAGGENAGKGGARVTLVLPFHLA